VFQPRYVTRRNRVPVGVGWPAEYCDSVSEQHRPGSVHVTKSDTADRPRYPGERLGLPETGRGAVSGMARRVGAILIDWLLCTFLVLVAIRPPHSQVEYWTLVVFAAQDAFLTALTGLTIGKLVLRIRVARLDGRLVGGWALVRTLLLLTVIPPLVFDSDLRGLHDRAANTVVVRFLCRRWTYRTFGRGGRGIRPARGIGPCGNWSEDGSAFSRLLRSLTAAGFRLRGIFISFRCSCLTGIWPFSLPTCTSVIGTA